MDKDKLGGEETERLYEKNKVIAVSKECIEQVKAKLVEIEEACDKDELKDKVSRLISFINNNILKYDMKKKDVEKLIYDMMVEVKYKDKELNTNLYILYQDLKNNRITLERAIELFNTYELMQYL